MKRQMKSLMMALCALCALAAVSFAQAAGEWDAAMETPGGSATPYKLKLTADGEKLAGTIKGQRGEYPISGTLKGKEIKLMYALNYNDSVLPVLILGTLEGDAIKATTDINNGSFQGAWTAKRVSGATNAMAAAPAGDVTGVWNAEVETSAGSGAPTWTLKQEGEKITGNYDGTLGKFPMTGTLKGDAIELSFKVSGQVEGTVVYKGTVSGNTMKGTVDLAGIATGTFKATKK